MSSIFQVITLLWSLQGGQYLNNAINDNGFFTSNSPYFFDTSFEFQIPMSWKKGDKNQFFVGADTENQFFKAVGIEFSPWQDTYKINLGIRVFGVEIGYSHECIHPIEVVNTASSKYFGGYDKVYAKISGSF